MVKLPVPHEADLEPLQSGIPANGGMFVMISWAIGVAQIKEMNRICPEDQLLLD
jgi:hypothetical protein